MMIDAGFTTLAAFVVAQGAGVMFWAGLINQRVKTLEKAVEPIATLRTDMATLTERMETLIALLKHGEATMPLRRVSRKADG